MSPFGNNRRHDLLKAHCSLLTFWDLDYLHYRKKEEVLSNFLPLIERTHSLVSVISVPWRLSDGGNLAICNGCEDAETSCCKQDSVNSHLSSAKTTALLHTGRGDTLQMDELLVFTRQSISWEHGYLLWSFLRWIQLFFWQCFSDVGRYHHILLHQ